MKVSDLACDAIDLGPIGLDWRQVGQDVDEPAWRSHEAGTCEACGERLILRAGDGDCQHRDLVGDSTCEGAIPLSEGPMMNFFWPLPDGPEDVPPAGGPAWRWDLTDGVRRIAHLPVCLIELSERHALGNGCGINSSGWGLALTGGGMDLSAQICEAYMRLGFLPPAVLARRLPAMCGFGTSTRDEWIAAGCRRALRIQTRWNRSGLANVDRTIRSERDRKAERAPQPDVRP